MPQTQMMRTDRLTANPRNVRTHSKRQIAQVAKSIQEFGFVVPILVDETHTVIAGHARKAAAEQLALPTVPVVVLSGLSDAKKRALALADNKIAQNAGWDRERLAVELAELSGLLVEHDLEIEITGFEPVEIDQLHIDFEEPGDGDREEVSPDAGGPEVSRLGDIWCLHHHRLACGDARDTATVARLMHGQRATMGFMDPPFNVPAKLIGGRGRTKHPDFMMGRGEMSRPEFVSFLTSTLGAAAAVSTDGAIHYVCTDWRHVPELFQAGETVYGTTLNLVVWDKTNAGQGSFYRSQHELIGVFRVGERQHLNNVQLGRHGRNRSNVWRFPGVNSFRPGRMEELRGHPTSKPVGLVAEAIRDCARRDDIVLDTFCGGGTTLMAAERVGRRGYGLELDPRYVDATIRRWQALSRRDAVHAETGRTFDECAVHRQPVERRPRKTKAQRPTRQEARHAS